MATLPRIAPDANNPHPSPSVRKVMRLYNAGSASERHAILELLSQWRWKKGLPPWYTEIHDPRVTRLYNAMSRKERVEVSALFARYMCWR